MRAFRLRFISFFLISFFAFANFAFVAAPDATEKTEIVDQMGDSTVIDLEQKVIAEKKEIVQRKSNRESDTTSYNFIYYLVAIIVKAFSYYPQR